MSKIKDLERQVEQLSESELVTFREWFAQFDAAAWDRQIDNDSLSGKLDALAEKSRRDHAAGRFTKL